MDTRSFAARIDNLLTDKTRARAMGQRGHERVTRDFDFATYINNLENLLESVCADFAPPSPTLPCHTFAPA